MERRVPLSGVTEILAKSAYHNDRGALSVKGEGWRVKAALCRSIPFTLDPPPCTESSQGLFDSCSKGVVALLRSLPFAWAVSRVKVSEAVKVKIVSAEVR